MRTRGWSGAAGLLLLLCCALAPLACESTPQAERQPSVSARRARDVAASRLSRDDRQGKSPTTLPSRPVYPTEEQVAMAGKEIIQQIPGPAMEEERLTRELATSKPASRPSEINWPQRREEMKRIIKRVRMVKRPNSVRLALSDVIRRTLQHSYAIQVQSYNPAVDATRIVEAEAQFDAVFFSNFSYNKQDRPNAVPPPRGSTTDARSFETGVRKLLSTGTQVQTSYSLSRSYTDPALSALNPQYADQFTVQFSQPFLRNFGLDFNRAQIELRRLDRAISLERLQRAIRETLYNVEQAYWRLLEARCNVTVTARLLSSLETILDSLEQRAKVGYDVYVVQLSLTRSRIEQRQVEFIQRLANVKDTEDALKRLMNDPDLPQASEIEIIPSDVPTIEPIVIDQLGEVTAGLTHRPELHETKLTIEQAQVAVGVAKNQALPKLDALFRYIVDGLGSNPDRAFSQLTENDFNEYVVGLEFEWPIGNRGPEAALRRARLQQAQAIAQHRDQIEGVINDVNGAIRDLQTKYDQIGPSLRAARASYDQLQATRARQERRDPANLQVELDAEAALASARQALAQFIADYNIALVNLERQKGTLLRFNNIVIRGLDEEQHMDPYRPVGP